MALLEINSLQAKVEEKQILNGINLSIKPGEVHAIMGPNGSGKSTLSNVLAGNESYEQTGGAVLFDGVDLGELDAHERARAGLFLAFQYPVEIAGISNMYFLKAAVNAIREHRGEKSAGCNGVFGFNRREEKVGKDSGGFIRACREFGVFRGERRSGMRFFKWRCLNLKWLF